MAQVTVKLHEDEKKALVRLAELERREPQQQASLLIRDELVRRGLLTLPDLKSAQLEPANGHN